MIFRLTQKMAKKIHESPDRVYPVSSDPFSDWSVHLFTAQRAQYIIVLNTASLYSVVLHGRGITDHGEFIDQALSFMARFMSDDGFQFQFRRLIAPAAGEIMFSKLSDHRVIGSMNDLVYSAKVHLVEQQLSPYETSQRLNETPMGMLKYNSPREAFAALAPAAAPQD